MATDWTVCASCGRVVLKEHVNEAGDCLNHAAASVDVNNTDVVDAVIEREVTAEAESMEDIWKDLGRPADTLAGKGKPRVK